MDETPRDLVVEVLTGFPNEEWPLQEVLDAIAKVPAEHREAARMVLEEDYGSTSLKITYIRPETAEEVERRVSERRSYERRAQSEYERKEREQYERLKAKFGES